MHYNKEVMHMKRYRLVAVALCIVLVFSFVLTAFAASYCNYQVNGGICGKTLTWVRTGQSAILDGSHTYGGILGIGTKVCNYSYFYVYKSNKCAAGHITEAIQERHEYGHSCGTDNSR
jgi:hypothetical protein